MIKKLWIWFVFSLLLWGDVGHDKAYVISTGTKGGTYYPVGKGMASLLSEYLLDKGMLFGAIPSQGSGENIVSLINQQVDFAFIQALFGSMAWNGVGKYQYKPHRTLRAITSLWPNVEQFIVDTQYAKTGTILDMKNLYGKQVSIGAKHSGSMLSTLYIFGLLDIDDQQMKINHLGHGKSADAFNKKQIASFNPSAGVPTRAVEQIFQTMKADKFKLLEFNENDLITIRNKLTVYFPYRIKANTYSNQSKDISTIAQANVLITRDDVSIDTVYWMTKTLYENIEEFYKIHPATHAMVLQKSIDGLPLPLHEGAAKFYKEKGIKLPFWIWNDTFKVNH